MKVAVVGGGSTYTPELVDGIARLQHLVHVDELVLTDPAEERLSLVTGISQRIFAKYGQSGACHVHHRSWPCRVRCRGRSRPAEDWWSSGAGGRRDSSVAVWLCRPGDHGCGRARQGVAYGAGDLADCRASLSARRSRMPGSSTSQIRWASSRADCLIMVIALSDCATSRSAISGPRRVCSASNPPRCCWTTSGSTT